MVETELKPTVNLINADGNIFNLIGIASKALKRAGMKSQAEELVTKAFNCQSYDEALRVIMDYVEVE